MKDGGPAFQVDTPGTSHYGLVCVNLRDYFAAKAMQSLLLKANECNGVVGVNSYEHDLSQTAYVIADAMLAAQEKGNE